MFNLFMIFGGLIYFVIVGAVVTGIFSLPIFLLYKNIGEDKPWKAFIPVWGLKPKFDVAGMNMLLLLVVFIPLIGPFVAIAVYASLNYKFYLAITGSKDCATLAVVFEPFIIIYLVLSGSYESPYEFVEVDEYDTECLD